ncbi:hypothetical protein MKX03_016967, partial [Papaver bracteatum]
NIGLPLVCQAQPVLNPGEGLTHPFFAGPSAHFSSSVNLDSSSLRSLRKKKSQMSKEQETSSLSVFIHKTSNSENGPDNEVYIEVDKSLSIRENCKQINSSSEDIDDADSHTSGSARSNMNASGDSSKVAKGISDKLNTVYGKLENSGHPSGI